MKNRLQHINAWMLGLLLLAGCTAEETVTTGGHGAGEDIVGQPVLFTVGNVGQDMTRAGIPYMAQDGRFVCTMYYHAVAGDDGTGNFDIVPKGSDGTGGTATTSWLKVNNTVGNSVYRLATCEEPANADVDEDGKNDNLDDYGFDRSATVFFWQNRLSHAFLALADYNKLTTNNGNDGTLKLHPNASFGKDLMTPAEGVEDIDPTGVADNRYVNVYDLTRGTFTSITQQPDPILALTIMKPAGATQEANRVELYFKHQFSQIQVNLKGAADNSADITSDQIESVELLGVSETAYVYNRLNANGTIGAATGSGIALTGGAADGVDVQLDKYSDEHLAKNRWGTSFEMFDMATGKDEDDDKKDDGYAIGFLKSFNAIAFGQLWALRIKWHEGTKENPGIVHTSTFEVPAKNEEDINLRQLASGKKYVYDLELRRGTLAVIRTQIIDWAQKSNLVYSTNGTIVNEQ